MSLLQRLVPDLPARTLGFYRLVVAVMLFGTVHDLGLPDAPFPRELHLAQDPLADLAWVHALAGRPDLVGALETAILAGLALVAVGLWTRASFALVAAGLVVWTLVRLQHTGVHPWAIGLLFALAICWSPLGDGFSADEAIRRLRGRPSRASWHGRAYGFPLWIPGLLLGTAMAAAAISKLRHGGPEWILGGAVKYHFVTDAASAPVDWGLWIASRPWAAVLASFFAVAVEGLLVVGPFTTRRPVRLALGLAGAALLAGFYLFQNEVWLAWWMLLLAFFVPWPALFEALRSLVPAHTAFVDGGCALCRRTARVWHALDLFDRIEIADARDEAALARRGRGLGPADLLGRFHVLQGRTGRFVTGADAYGHLARSVPLLWPLLPLWLLPGVRPAARAVYERVAARRGRATACPDGACRHGGSPGGGPPVRPPQAAVRPLGAPHLAAAGVILILQVLASAFALEVQPILSSYPMYSNVYESTAQFDAMNATKPVLSFSRIDPETGAAADLTPDIEALEIDAILRDAALDLSGGRPLGPAHGERLRGAAAIYERERGRPLGRVLVRIDQEAFDWTAGRFYWKHQDEVLGELDAEAGVLYPPPKDPAQTSER